MEVLLWSKMNAELETHPLLVVQEYSAVSGLRRADPQGRARGAQVYRVTSYTWPCVYGTLLNVTCPVYGTVQ